MSAAINDLWRTVGVQFPPPFVGQRGRPRVAGGERNTTPRQRKGVIEHEVSEWVEKEKCVQESEERKQQDEGFFFLDPFRSGSVVSVGQEQDVGQESTEQCRCKRRAIISNCPHSFAQPRSTQQGSSKLRPAPFRLQRPDLSARVWGELFTQQDPKLSTHCAAAKVFQETLMSRDKWKKLMWSSGVLGERVHLPAEPGSPWWEQHRRKERCRR